MEQKGFEFETVGEEKIKSPKIFTVSQLTKELRSMIEGKFGEVWVSAEISNFRNPNSGHYYFTLKDDSAQLSAVMFRAQNSKLPFTIEDGLEVVCFGRLSVYEARGQYQIIITHLEPKGVGALQLAFEQLKKKLQGEGLFDPRRKKPLPFLPKKIGIVTSETGAAIRDILNILARRFPGLEILLAPVKVQGEGSAQEIARAIAVLNQREDIDVMIVGRGGGSLEDLWAFNEEAVARAIFASRIPIISAVGHEIDFTIADFVADVRAPTPSAAAELVIPRKEDLSAKVKELHRQLMSAIVLDFQFKKQAVEEWRQRLKDPSLRFTDFLIRLDDLRSRLRFGWQVGWDKRSQNLKKLMSNLDHLSPLNVLAKGYSIVCKTESKIAIKSVQELKVGADIDITFHEGTCLARVTSKN